VVQAHAHLVDRRRRGHELPAARHQLVDPVALAQDDPRPPAVLDDRAERGVAQRPRAVTAREALRGAVDVGVPHPAREQLGDDGGLGDVLDGVDARLAVGLRGADQPPPRPLPDRGAGDARQLADLARQEAPMWSRTSSHRT